MINICYLYYKQKSENIVFKFYHRLKAAHTIAAAVATLRESVPVQALELTLGILILSLIKADSSGEIPLDSFPRIINGK